MVKILKVHGLVWFVWFDLGLRALNFNTVTVQYGYITKVGIELLGQLKKAKKKSSSVKTALLTVVKDRRALEEFLFPSFDALDKQQTFK